MTGSVVEKPVERDEFKTPCSPQGLRVLQISTDESRDSEAFYIDCPSWSDDSKLLLFRRHASADWSKKPGYWICSVEEGFKSHPVVEHHEPETYDNPSKKTEASIDCVMDPAGRRVYHIMRMRDKICVFPVNISTGARDSEPVCTAPAPLRTRGAFSISADGKRLLMGNWLGDGKKEGAPWGATIFELEQGTSRVIEFGNGYRNMHCQYSRNPEPAFSHDILLNVSQPKFADGSWLTPPDGSWRWKDLPAPADNMGGAYTVVRDDGTDWRMVPLGRHPEIHNGGHNVWRGREYSVVTSAYDTRNGRWRAPLLEATPMPVGAAGMTGPQVEMLPETWLGQRRPGARVVDLTRYLARADSCHFAFDASGRHFVSDTDGYAKAEYSFLYIGAYVAPSDDEPYVRTRYLLLPRTSWKTQPAHPHPYLSPNGRFVVFQSNFTGRPQVYVAFDFEYP